MLKFYQTTGRELAMLLGSRGNALCEGQEWYVVSQRVKGCTTGTALLHSVGLLGRGTAQGRRKIHCEAAFWRRPPPFSGQFRTHGGLHSCAACQLPEHHSDHGAAASTIYRPTQILPYFSELLQQAIPHRVCNRTAPFML